MTNETEQAAQRLLDWERTRPFGYLLGATLDDVDQETRSGLVAQAQFSLSAEGVDDAAYLLARQAGVDWSVPHARPFWVQRVQIARGVVEVKNVPPPYDEEAARLEREAELDRRFEKRGDPSTCNRCGAPMRWAKHWKTQNQMPLDPDPVAGFEEAGNVLLDGNGIAYVFKDREQAMEARTRDLAEGGQRGIVGEPMTSHHFTCRVVREERERQAEDRRRAELERVGGEQMGLGL